MKNLVNRDYEKLQDQTYTCEPMLRRDHKKLPYSRVRLVQENGKFSSKQSDKNRLIARAQRTRQKLANQAYAALLVEEEQFIEEDFNID